MANTSWNERVWALIAQIPKGKVASYGQIAAMLGHPRRARRVGYALHQTPDGVEIPWQRVINAQGRISFPAHGHQFHLQRAMLEAEGVVFDEDGRVDLKVFGWRPL